MDDDTNGYLASIKDLQSDESWKDQIEDWTLAFLKDGICAGAGRDYKMQKCIADRFNLNIDYGAPWSFFAIFLP